MYKLDKKIFGDHNILLMVKFTTEKYVDSILKGNLYMNNIKYFIELEDKTNIKGQGDKYEAANVINDAIIKIFKEGTKDVLAKGVANNAVVRYDVFNNIPVFCLSAFQADDFKIVEQTDDFYKVIFDINQNEIDNMINNFGEKAIVLNPCKFFNKVRSFFVQNSIKFSAEKVNYEDLKINNIERFKKYKNNSTKPLFVKDIFFKYQREFRIIPYNMQVENHYIAEIGSLEDSTVVVDTNDLFRCLNLKILK